MQANCKTIFVAGLLSLGVAFLAVPSSARAQAVGAAPRAASPGGYYYSPGGYSGGTYFSPGYYPTYAPTANRAGTGTYYGYGTNSVTPRSPARGRFYDPTTGRRNIDIGIAKPWLRPLQ